MKKRIIIIGVALVILIILAVLVFNKKEDVFEDLPTYQGNIVCTIEGYDKIDGREIPYKTKAYLTVEDDYLLSIVYQTVTENQKDDMLSSILKIYNEIDGITVFTDRNEDYYVLTIKYDYTTIDLKQVDEKFGDILDQNSFFKRYKKIPINYGEYKAIELKGYECHEN